MERKKEYNYGRILMKYSTLSINFGCLLFNYLIQLIWLSFVLFLMIDNCFPIPPYIHSINCFGWRLLFGTVSRSSFCILYDILGITVGFIFHCSLKFVSETKYFLYILSSKSNWTAKYDLLFGLTCGEVAKVSSYYSSETSENKKQNQKYKQVIYVNLFDFDLCESFVMLVDESLFGLVVDSLQIGPW